MLSLIDPRVWIGFVVSMTIAFGLGLITGYVRHAATASQAQAVQEAKQTTTQAITTTTVQATDTKTIARMQARINAATAKATALEALINDARTQEPVPPADCALPERVRDEINRSLTSDTE